MKDESIQALNEYRRIRKTELYALAIFLLFPFVIFPVLGFLLRFQSFSFLIRLGMIPFLCELTLLITIGHCEYLQYVWECPRCGTPFGRKREECQNCSLPKWATENDASTWTEGAI
ncbi:MAG: hypothetical protein WBX19_09050 [Terracidiphilus sp.]